MGTIDRGPALRIQETLKGMSQEEELAYWRVRSQAGRRRFPGCGGRLGIRLYRILWNC
jgi:hypothetical protein